MNPCDECSLYDKIYQCCGRYPPTGASVSLQVDETCTLQACEYLDASGRCTVYAQRPPQCQTFFCERFDACAGGLFPDTAGGFRFDQG